MNDPGLDEPIGDRAEDVENSNEQEEIEEEEEEYLEPSRWWFASTAFPLIAGTLGPMASAFSICALVVHWRQTVPPDGSEEEGQYVKDPSWLVGINAAQLAVALISNMFLLLNMARRVRFSIAQPVTIAGWYLSAITLIGLVSCASGPLQLEPKSGYAYTQAFYYAIFAAVLYFLVATLMVVTVWGASRGNYDKEFKLTMSQRTLMLQTISYLAYLLLGALVFAHVEGWNFLDAVYWADFTLLTVGIGDYSPQTHLGRGLLFPFAIGGIIILGLVIGSIRSLVLERGKMKMAARMVEKRRQQLLEKLQKKNRIAILEPMVKEKGQRGSNESVETRKEIRIANEMQRRRIEFELMRQVQEEAATRRRWNSLLISAITWLFLWFVGAAVFEACEKVQALSYFEAMYFAYTSLLTIGYGDFYPLSNSGKAFFVVWSLLSVPALTILISNMGDTVIKMIRDLTLWVGNFTVLPGDEGVKTTLRHGAEKMKQSHPFKAHRGPEHEIPPGLLGEANEMTAATGRNDSEQDIMDHTPLQHNSAGSPGRGHAAQKKHKEYKRGSQEALPTQREEYHCLLMREILDVMKHLNASPARQYTYDEWAWYLRLAGEDEGTTHTHRRALKHPRADGEGLGAGRTGRGPHEEDLDTNDGEKGEKETKKKERQEAAAAEEREEEEEEKEEAEEEALEKWSWIGHRSPLMGNKDEAEWVLQRLSRKLDRELEMLRREVAQKLSEKEG